MKEPDLRMNYPFVIIVTAIMLIFLMVFDWPLAIEMTIAALTGWYARRAGNWWTDNYPILLSKLNEWAKK